MRYRLKYSVWSYATTIPQHPNTLPSSLFARRGNCPQALRRGRFHTACFPRGASYRICHDPVSTFVHSLIQHAIVLNPAYPRLHPAESSGFFASTCVIHVSLHSALFWNVSPMLKVRRIYIRPRNAGPLYIVRTCIFLPRQRKFMRPKEGREAMWDIGLYLCYGLGISDSCNF